MSERALKKQILALLREPDLNHALAAIRAMEPRKAMNGLFAGICSHEETTRWHAITAMGQVVAAIADRDMEDARVIMRRLMWSLNDESGGIGWGAPEAFGEILACHPGLAAEYAHILVSFMREDGYYLEYEPMQAGLMWGLGRFAEVNPELLRKFKAGSYLPPYLDSKDPTVRGLAARVLGLLGEAAARPALQKLINDPGQIRLFTNQDSTTTSVGDLAGAALSQLR